MKSATSNVIVVNCYIAGKLGLDRMKSIFLREEQIKRKAFYILKFRLLDWFREQKSENVMPDCFLTGKTRSSCITSIWVERKD